MSENKGLNEGLVAEIRQILDSHTHDTGVQKAVLRVAEWAETLGQALGRPAASADQPPEILGPRARRGEVELRFTIHQSWPGVFSTRPNWVLTFPSTNAQTLYLRRNGEVRDSGDEGFETVGQLLDALGILLCDVVASRDDDPPIGGIHD